MAIRGKKPNLFRTDRQQNRARWEKEGPLFGERRIFLEPLKVFVDNLRERGKKKSLPRKKGGKKKSKKKKKKKNPRIGAPAWGKKSEYDQSIREKNHASRRRLTGRGGKKKKSTYYWLTEEKAEKGVALPLNAKKRVEREGRGTTFPRGKKTSVTLFGGEPIRKKKEPSS